MSIVNVVGGGCRLENVLEHALLAMIGGGRLECDDIHGNLEVNHGPMMQNAQRVDILFKRFRWIIHFLFIFILIIHFSEYGFIVAIKLVV